MPTAEELISAASIGELAARLSAVAPGGFPQVRKVASALGPLGLSERARAVRDASCWTCRVAIHRWRRWSGQRRPP